LLSCCNFFKVSVISLIISFCSFDLSLFAVTFPLSYWIFSINFSLFFATFVKSHFVILSSPFKASIFNILSFFSLFFFLFFFALCSCFLNSSSLIIPLAFFFSFNSWSFYINSITNSIDFLSSFLTLNCPFNSFIFISAFSI